MPELPEVENVMLSLQGLGAQGQCFAKVDLRAPKLRTALNKNLKIKLPGQSILNLTRRAKFLLFETEKFFVVSHLGMTGWWRPLARGGLIKHDHVVFRFQSGLELVYNDPRRFGLLELVEKAKIGRHAWLKNLGPEPFDHKFTGNYLFEATRGLAAPIKTVIMDQKRVVGVGNIYASEALFLAKIKPSRPAGKLKRDEAAALVGAIQAVLTKAIAAGGSTIRDYQNSNGESGSFQNQFVVYDRAGEPCVTCSAPLKSKFIGQRNTYWCPKCQF
jgi:formamidopyrimidine-DNA glycosylase